MVFLRGTENGNSDMENAEKQDKKLSVLESLGNMKDDAVEQQSRTTAGFTL